MFTRDKKKQSNDPSQELIQDFDFKDRHRNNETAFTRVRQLHFPLLLVLMLLQA